MPRLAILLLTASLFMNAQSSAPEDLSRTLASLDEALFDAYNKCELDKFKSFFTDDVEFYHDQGGLTTGSQTLVDQVKTNICGKTRRELVTGSLEAYPMRGYGAVQVGVHRFYQAARGPKPTGEAKFIHLWQNKDGAWKITRVISYDHAALPSQ